MMIVGVLIQGCFIHKKALKYTTSHLEIEQLAKHTYVHRSYLYDNKWGHVACNGVIYINNGEAIVFDTPVDDSASNELLNWIKQEKGAKTTAVVVNHFHADCLGGLRAFHAAGITSYSNELTRQY